MSEDRHGGNVGDVWDGVVLVGWLVGGCSSESCKMWVVGGRKAGGLQMAQAVVATARQFKIRLRVAGLDPGAAHRRGISPRTAGPVTSGPSCNHKKYD